MCVCVQLEDSEPSESLLNSDAQRRSRRRSVPRSLSARMRSDVLHEYRQIRKMHKLF